MNKSTKVKSDKLIKNETEQETNQKSEQETLVETKPPKVCKIPKSAKIIKLNKSKNLINTTTQDKTKKTCTIPKSAKITKSTIPKNVKNVKSTNNTNNTNKTNKTKNVKGVKDKVVAEQKESDSESESEPESEFNLDVSLHHLKKKKFSYDETYDDDSLGETYKLIQQFREFFKGKSFFGVNFDDLSDLSDLSDETDKEEEEEEIDEDDDDFILTKHIREWKNIKKFQEYNAKFNERFNERFNDNNERFSRLNEKETESEKEWERQREIDKQRESDKKEEDMTEYEREFRREIENLKARIAQYTMPTEKCDVPDCLKPKIAHTSHYLKIIDNFNQELVGELMYIINIIWLNFQDIVLILKKKDELNTKKKGGKTKKNELDDYVFRNVTEVYGQYSIDPDYLVFGIGFNRNKDMDY